MLSEENINFLRSVIFDAGSFLIDAKVNTLSYKQDLSPVTNIDIQINSFLESKLSYFNIPILSEERKFIKYPNNDFWLIDPLDGTKNFINGDGQCTINIALMRNMKPIFGMVYAPFFDELYYGPLLNGEVLYINKGKLTSLISSNKKKIKTHVSSKLHKENFTLPSDFKLFTLGSSLKYVRIAKADYDFCIRTQGSSEWDIAACHPILKALGGNIIDLNTKQEIRYNKNNFRNTSFLVFRSPFNFDTFESLLKDVLIYHE